MKLTLSYTATVWAMAAIAATGFAASAYADPPTLNGTYATDGADDGMVWTIATACAGDTCTGTVASNKGWTVPTQLIGGQWKFTVTKPDGVICDDGRYAPAYISIAVDPVTLAGAIATDSNYGCPGGQITNAPFQLTKVG